jgi:serine/threonine-protein kinase
MNEPGNTSASDEQLNAFLAYLEARDNGAAPDQPPPSCVERFLDDERFIEEVLNPVRAAPPAAGGTLFGNYELLMVIGEGGQGVVYRARQIHVDKEVALKTIHPADRAAALRELRMVANLEHDNLVRVYHVGEHDGLLYYTMRYAEKGSLETQLDRFCLPRSETADLADRQARLAAFMARIARAVAYLHRHGVLHRDLKPGNILLDAEDEPLVTDLGLARNFTAPPQSEAARDPVLGETLTVDGTKKGTPRYMAPEQLRGETDLTPAADVYALGVILYQLLTGRLPYDGTVEEYVAQVLDPERLPPMPAVHNPNVGLGSDLDLMCRKCLRKDPLARYTAANLADDLEHVRRGEPTSVRPVGWLEGAARRVVREINHKLQLRGLRRWGAIDLWDAGLNLAFNGTVYAVIRADAPPWALWAALLAFIGVWWWMFLTYLFRRERLQSTERHLAFLWAGVTLAQVTLFTLYCPPFGRARAADLLAYYPPWTVVNGLAFLVVGRLYWGRYYLIGLAHFAVALLMPLLADLAPLGYGAFVAVCMVTGALDHYRTARIRKARRSCGTG